MTEACDDGVANADKADTCRTDCRAPMCGDNIVDTGEACDHGEDGDETCSKKCEVIEPVDSGCCSSSGGQAGSLTLAGFVGLLLVRRRRRR